MAGIIANGELIPTPAPGLRRYGLFSAATVLDDLDARGIASGFQLFAEDCGVAEVYDANCLTHPTKEFEEGQSLLESAPYWTYAGLKCGSVGRTPQEIEASVRRRLTGGEQQAVEAQLWGGTAIASNPALTDYVGTVTVTPGAAGAGAAIAALEEAFYDTYGYVGTIHVNTRAYAAAAYAQLIVRGSAGALTTPLGSVWSFGSGYGITGPADDVPDAGSVWAFMTPPVLVRRSPVVVPDVVQTMDRLHNQYYALAERVYTHGWLCDTVAAVQIPLAAPAVDTGVAP